MGNYQKREELKNKFSEELSHTKPKLERFIEIAEEFEIDNLNTIKKLNRRKKTDDVKIKGALKQTINTHGPITLEYIGSATKRINGALMLSEHFIIPESKPIPYSIRGMILGAVIATILCSIISLVF